MLKPAYLKDAALLADIAQAIETGERHLWWLGQSGFLIVQHGRALLLDPYLSDSLTKKYAKTDKPHVRITELVVTPAALAATAPLELITSSHNHTDHFDPETLDLLLAARAQTRLLIPAANRALALERLPTCAERLIEIDAGQTITIGEPHKNTGVPSHEEGDLRAPIVVTAVTAAHPTVERDSAGRCRFLGYVVQWSGMTIYHGGDTMWHPELIPALQRFSIDLALLPINGDRPERRVAGNLDGRQAAQLAHTIGARWVIPCHYDLFEFNTVSPDEFVSECNRLGQPFKILRNGEGLDWPAPSR